MKTIYKFTIQDFTPMQAGAKLLCVALQNGWPTVWAEVDTNAPMVTRRIDRHGTGWDLPEEPGTYIGTIHTPDGFVWHYYDGEGV